MLWAECRGAFPQFLTQPPCAGSSSIGPACFDLARLLESETSSVADDVRSKTVRSVPVLIVHPFATRFDLKPGEAHVRLRAVTRLDKGSLRSFGEPCQEFLEVVKPLSS